MSNGITDQAQLESIMSEWMFLNEIRVSLWTIQWLCMMAYFAYQANLVGRVSVVGAKK
jgi:hypothetical protein